MIFTGWNFTPKKELSKFTGTTKTDLIEFARKEMNPMHNIGTMTHEELEVMALNLMYQVQVSQTMIYGLMLQLQETIKVNPAVQLLQMVMFSETYERKSRAEIAESFDRLTDLKYRLDMVSPEASYSLATAFAYVHEHKDDLHKKLDFSSGIEEAAKENNGTIATPPVDTNRGQFWKNFGKKAEG